MGKSLPPICDACGGSGARPDLITTDLGKIRLRHRGAWRKQLENRPRVLKNVDRFLGHRFQARLNKDIDNEALIGLLMDQLSHAENHRVEAKTSRGSERGQRLEAINEALFIAAAEIIWHLSDRCYPATDEDIHYLLRDLQESETYEDPDDPDLGTSD